NFLDELDARVEHLNITDGLLGHLPPELKYIKDDYSPSGPATIAFRYKKGGQKPVREWTIEPEGMSGAFFNFRYPVKNVRWRLCVDTAAGPPTTRVDLTAQAGAAPVKLTGTIQGEKGTSAVALDISGQDVLLDQDLYDALPDRVRRAACQFLPQASRQFGLRACPMGSADIDVSIRRDKGQQKLLNTYTVSFRRSGVLYAQSPYPLETVSGVLTVHPDHHWECRHFHGYHAGGEMAVEGQSFVAAAAATETAPSYRPPERVEV